LKKIEVSPRAHKLLSLIYRKSAVVTALAFTTAVSGALVSGQDAGNSHNYWPHFDEYYEDDRNSTSNTRIDNNNKDKHNTDALIRRWAPSSYFDASSYGGSFFRKFTEDGSSVQFNHRMLAYATVGGAVGLGFLGQRARAFGVIKQHFPKVTTGASAVGLLSLTQMSLGITTLLHNVPMPLAAAHQMGSLAVITAGTYTAVVGREAVKRIVVRAAK